MLSERPLWLLAGALGAALLVGLGILIDRGVQGPAPLEIATEGGGIVKVHVTGAVRSPGVYSLRDGDRTQDAIAEAGGATEAADLDQINLARRLRDEDHILVPVRGQQAIAGTQLMNINTAPAELLATLPGIGDIRARNVVASRERDGSFRRPEELLERRLVTQAVYEQLKDRITIAGP